MAIKSQSLIRILTIVVVAVALFILPRLWGWSGWPLIIIFGLMVFTFFMVRWHARNTGYQCPVCEYCFTITPGTDFLSPHLGGEKILRCPNCGMSAWCREIDPVHAGTESMAPASIPIVAAGKATTLRIQVIAILAAYAILWGFTLTVMPTEPGGISAWTWLKIPIVTFPLPVLHFLFCTYAISRGYRSRLYLIITMFVGVFLLLALWIQYSILMGLPG